MPLLEPKKDETLSEFNKRCVPKELPHVKKKYNKTGEAARKQAVAICSNHYRDRKGKKSE